MEIYNVLRKQALTCTFFLKKPWLDSIEKIIANLT